jgi:hypothetical protein
MYSLTRPVCKFEIYDNDTLVTANRILFSANVDTRFDPPANECALILNPLNDDIKVGDILKLYLGYDDVVVKVYTGYIDEISEEFGMLSIKSISGLRTLLNTRKNLSYNRNTIDAIIRKLVDLCDVEIDKIETTDISKSRYVFSDSFSMYEHINNLADLIGCDIYMNTDDRFMCRVWNPDIMEILDKSVDEVYKQITKNPARGYTHKFSIGVDVLDINFRRTRSRVRKVVGVSSEKSGKKIVDFSLTYSEISENGSTIVVDLSYVSDDDMQKITMNLLKKHNVKTVCTLKVLGSPQVRLGDAVIIHGFADKYEGKKFKVTGVKHIFSLDEGFYTEIGLQS